MNEVQQLLDKYKLGQISRDELLRLSSLVETGDYEPEIKSAILDSLYSEVPQSGLWTNQKSEAALQHILSSPHRRLIPIRTWHIAAAIAGVLIAAAFYLKFNPPASPAPKAVALNFAPGSNKAMLVLADGKTIPLDSINQGTVAQQGDASIFNSGEELSYKATGNNNQVVFNTVVTPRGGQYQLTLADGTKVWLNSGSSLRFPTSFNEAERNVELSGEGYFQVASNSEQPFKVKVKGNSELSVDVLGTSFNIMAYPDEQGIVTTLESGSVQLVHGTTKSILEPGYGGTLLAGASDFNIEKADLEQALAWKEGKFRFRNTNIQTIMRQIARWYNIEVTYQGNLSDKRFTGIISRKENAASLLKILSTTQLIDIETNDNKILIKPHEASNQQ
ncbi:FecR family protein [Chitinophaga silvatica]|uniref:FecR family protein n=1 Tax=Chitinophaga silvatica TaxID=2282649 RepID=A0A3E1YF86_9BACT|nr:FecR family protein [Chitinophaga silvatica]RFS24977.1 FecR family protein [Chitinophaga silvatica]